MFTEAMGMKPGVLVSLCLIGIGCRYDGRDNGVDLRALEARCALIPVCPEQQGGLPTPRVPAECRGGRVVTRDGGDVTAAFRRGAGQAALLAEQCHVKYALLKARSPSCGAREIYDGSFSGRLVPGAGVTAEVLRGMGIEVYDEGQIDELICRIDSEERT